MLFVCYFPTLRSSRLHLRFIVVMLGDTEAKFASVERINYYSHQLQREGNSKPSKAPPAAWPDQGRLTFTDVVMRYRSSLEPALKGASFVVQPGETVGVVGRTGAGERRDGRENLQCLQLGVVTVVCVPVVCL
jgi:ABC-type multidrug transport system fused ATPase/permease subunit